MPDQNKMFQMAAHAAAEDFPNSDYPGAPFITVEDLNNLKYLYHGSNTDPSMVQQSGLLTRDSQQLPRLERDTTYQDSIYLTLNLEEAKWYGQHIYIVDFKKLDKSLLEADEDAIGHSADNVAYKWWGSLQIMSACRYLGDIPPSLIVDVLLRSKGHKPRRTK